MQNPSVHYFRFRQWPVTLAGEGGCAALGRTRRRTHRCWGVADLLRLKMLRVAAALVIAGAGAGATASVPIEAVLPTLNWQQRSDWLDVKSVGAKGDGKTDDTAAITKALLMQVDTEYGCGLPGHCGNATKTIYFPPGVYPISKQLVINHMYGGALIGHGAATTILWVGPEAPLVVSRAMSTDMIAPNRLG
jgi:hypothetical protein